MEIMANLVESILKRPSTWLRMNIKVELLFVWIYKVLFYVLIVIGIASEGSGCKHHFFPKHTLLQVLAERCSRGVLQDVHPDEVVVTEKVNGRRTTVMLKVAPSDMGKVIGKQGRIAKSLRSVVKAAASRENARADVEITD